MAISFVIEQDAQGSAGSLSFANPHTVAVGDLWVAFIEWPGASSNHSPAITDSLNAGAWNLPANLKYFNLSQNLELQIAWIRCDTAGTPTINATSLGTDFCNLCTLQFTGFVNAPSVVTADVTANNGTGTAMSATGFSNSVANEVILQASVSGAGNNATGLTGSFTNSQNAAGCVNGYTIKSTSGNALSYSATAAGSNPWVAMLAGFRDGTGAPNTGTLTLGGQSGAKMNTGITVPTAKVRDKVRELTRRYFIPNFAKPGKLILA